MSANVTIEQVPTVVSVSLLSFISWKAGTSWWKKPGFQHNLEILLISSSCLLVDVLTRSAYTKTFAVVPRAHKSRMVYIIVADLGVTLFVENWLMLSEKWLKIDLIRLGINKMTSLDLQKNYRCIHLHYNWIQIMARQKVSINRLSWQSNVPAFYQGIRK